MLSMRFICNLHLCYNFGLLLYDKYNQFQQIKITDPLLPYGPTRTAQRSDHR